MCAKNWRIIKKFTFFCSCIFESSSVTSSKDSKCVLELMQKTVPHSYYSVLPAIKVLSPPPSWNNIPGEY